MTKTELNKDSDFIVGEEKVLLYLLAGLFFAIFLYGAADVLLHGFAKITYINYMYIIALGPAFLFFKKARSKRVFIRVNSKGIYQDEILITDWSNYINAYISQKPKLLSIQDNFILVVEYHKNLTDGARRKIPLTNTQNKSEEDVLAAVQFFWKIYLNDNGLS